MSAQLISGYIFIGLVTLFCNISGDTFTLTEFHMLKF